MATIFLLLVVVLQVTVAQQQKMTFSVVTVHGAGVENCPSKHEREKASSYINQE